MSILSKTALKALFETNDVPTQANFADLIESVGVPTVSVVGNVSGTTATDASTADTFTMTLTGAITLSNPSNAIDGKAITWLLTQGGSGSYGVTLGNQFAIPSSATSPLAWSTAVGKTDVFVARYNSAATKWLVVSMIPGYTLS
jgi:hypothetical protein